MKAATIRKMRWFWPWQDYKEETWLEKMSQDGKHLKSVGLMGIYTFEIGEPARYAYRLDYLTTSNKDLQDYLQIFQDAGWEYVGEMVNWRYWRKRNEGGELPEIFTDTPSRIKKYQRVLAIMSFMLLLMVILGRNMFNTRIWLDPEISPVIRAVYACGSLLYLVIIPMYIVVVIQLLRRVNQLKKKL